MALGLEGAIAQLKKCRDDFDGLVRQRRANAHAALTEATSQASIIKDADVAAVTELQAIAADAATPAALKQYINGQLAFHARAKADQAAEV